MSNVATKSDLKNLKDEIRDEILEHMDYRFDRVYEDMATKDDLNELRLATKDDIDRIWAVMATKQDFQDLEERLTAKMASKDDINRIIDMLDAMAARQTIADEERLVMNYQLSRHERWHEQTAKHVGLKLSDN